MCWSIYFQYFSECLISTSLGLRFSLGQDLQIFQSVLYCSTQLLISGTHLFSSPEQLSLGWSWDENQTVLHSELHKFISEGTVALSWCLQMGAVKQRGYPEPLSAVNSDQNLKETNPKSLKMQQEMVLEWLKLH